MSAAVLRLVYERRAAKARAHAEAESRQTFLADAKGDPGPKGDKPAHEWKGTKLRFEQPDGSWGKFVDLKGKPGKDGDPGAVRVIAGGGSGGIDAASLSALSSAPTPSDYLVLQRGGQLYRVSLGELQAILGGLPAGAATVNGDPVMVNGQYITVTD